jgi:thiosulfate dehydrogenase
MMRGFVIGFFAAVLILAGGIGFCVISGIVPVAATDPPLPFEETLAHFAVDAHIARQPAKESPVPADEMNLVAGVRVYRQQCAGCHGLPGQPQPATGAKMYPRPPELFRGTGVTDDPVFESYWKVSNGIRLTGMPAFKTGLTDTELWQVSQLVAHGNGLPESVRKVLTPESPSAAQALGAASTPGSK